MKYQVKGTNISNTPEKTTVNVAIKAQKKALGIQGRTFAISCPCPALNCTNLWACATFLGYSLEGKNRVIKQLKLCRSCLRQHDGPCNFRNTHVCRQQKLDDMHNSILCPCTYDEGKSVNLVERNDSDDNDETIVNIAGHSEEWEEDETSSEDELHDIEYDFHTHVALMIQLDETADNKMEVEIEVETNDETEKTGTVQDKHGAYPHDNDKNVNLLHSSSHESLDLASLSVNKKARKDISEMKKLYNEIEKKREKIDKWEIATCEAGTSIVRQFCITRNEIVGHGEDNCVLNTDCIVPKCDSCES